MKKILVIKHGSLGDMAFALPSMMSIRTKYPDSLIDLLTENFFSSFLKKSNIFNEILIDNRKNSYFKSLANILNLIKNNYDLIIDLQNSKRTSIYNFLFRFIGQSLICSSRSFAQIRYRIPSQGKEKATTGLANQLSLLKINTIKSPNYDWLKINLDNKFPDRLVLFIPGVSKKNIHKQWQPENFAKLAKYCESKKYTICVVGTEQDTSSIKPILNVCDHVINKIDTSPPEVVYSIALKSSLIFSNDTGPGHIASLSNKNIVWLLNDNSVSKANIGNNIYNHKILSDSVKKITPESVINYINNSKLLEIPN